MSISMYQTAIPPLVRILNNLVVILEKAAVHAEAKKIDPSVLVNARLYPDMFALARQVQIATDGAKGCAARLSGQTPPVYEDTESTIPELIARVRKTADYLSTFTAEQIDGTEERPISIQLRSGELQFTGQSYLLNFVLPNFYFHVTTTYDILRHNGVELGKRDFLGNP